MDKERSGVGEYAYQLLDDWFREAAALRGLISVESEARIAPAAALRAQKLSGCDLGKCEFFLFYNSFHETRANLPKWDYPFVHYCGFRLSNKLLNFCLKFFKWPKFDKLITKNYTLYPKPYTLDYLIFPNQNFYALSRGVKKIVVVHDLAGELYPECFSLKSRLWHKMVNLRKMVKDAEKIITVSENTKFDLINLYKIEAAKIKVIYPMIAKPSFTHSRELENTDARKANQDYILFVGTIEPRKNVLGLLKAYELFCDTRGPTSVYTEVRPPYIPELWIAGKVGYRSKDVFDYWKGMRVHDKVKFLGYVPEEKKWKLLRGARVFVYPSLYEGFGMPVLEAISIGAPVVTSLTSSMHEVVSNRDILVDPNRIEDLAQAIDFFS
jgi:glycosyltransferase involved in cell wall biosynthesis